MLLINSINYIDGTDGLLIGYTILTSSLFYFLSDNQYQYLNIFLIFIYLLIIV
jgi:UDP-N-acetylmuramyl pentapeptide phosphotransferase/UDP-N-acetylglucosamine-1-phosphate transferase